MDGLVSSFRFYVFPVIPGVPNFPAQTQGEAVARHARDLPRYALDIKIYRLRVPIPAAPRKRLNTLTRPADAMTEYATNSKCTP